MEVKCSGKFSAAQKGSLNVQYIHDKGQNSYYVHCSYHVAENRYELESEHNSLVEFIFIEPTRK